VKEKKTYKRFNLIEFLAILGCVGMLFFECIFIFELYDHAVEQPAAPVQSVPAIETPLPVEAPVVPAVPAEVPPAQIETVPAAVPVG
jgi:hypothetical protein